MTKSKDHKPDIKREDLVPLHELARQAYDTLVQKLDKYPLPVYVNYTLEPLRHLRRSGIHNCVDDPHCVPGDPSTEYTDMFICRILDRWGSWRGNDGRHFKAELQKHLDYYSQYH